MTDSREEPLATDEETPGSSRASDWLSVYVKGVAIRDSVGGWTPTALAVVVGPALVGGLALLALDRYTDDLDLDAAGEAASQDR